MGDTEKLLPCPFCGNSDIKISQGNFGYSSFYCTISCNLCKAEITKEDDMYNKPKSAITDDAIKAWNKRASNKGPASFKPVDGKFYFGQQLYIKHDKM